MPAYTARLARPLGDQRWRRDDRRRARPGCLAPDRHRREIFCSTTIAGGVAPYTTKWNYRGSYCPQMDNKRFVTWYCSDNTVPTIDVVAYDATGIKATDSTSARCLAVAP